MSELTARRDAARAEAARLAGVITDIESKLNTATTAKEFTTAADLNDQLPPLREAWGVAQATARAFDDIIGQLAREQADREAAAAAEGRREQARADRDQAMAAEAEALADVERHAADIAPALDAVRHVMRQGVEAEKRAEQARRAAYDAMVVLGERDPGARVYGPNNITARIERDRMLHAIYHGRTL